LTINQNKISNNKIISFEDLKWIWKSIYKGWYLFFIIPTISLLIGVFYNYKIIPKYVSKIEILLKSNEVYDYQEKLYSNVGFYNYYGDITNQIRVITSYDLIQEALSRLNFNNSYFIVGRLNTKEFYEGLPFKVDINLINNELYEKPIDFKILDDNQYQLSYEMSGDKVVKNHHFDSTEFTVDYSINTKLIRLSKNLNSLSKINYRFVTHTDNYWVNKILSNLKVENLEYTSIISLELTDEIPNRSRVFLDTLATVYINYTLQNQFQINENTLKYINNQLGNVVEIIDSIEFDLQNLREEKGVLDIERESEQYFRQLMTHEANKRKLHLKIKSLQNLNAYIINVKDENILPPSLYVLNEDTYLEQSLSKFYNSQLSKIEMLYGVNKNHQALEKLNTSIAKQKRIF